MRFKKNLSADAALLLTTVVWGSTFVIAKDVLEVWSPLVYLTARFTLAAFVLALLFPKLVMRARMVEWRAGIMLGALVAVGYMVQSVGQIYTSPAKSAFITGLTTPLVPIVAFLILRVRPSAENLAGVLLASIGGALMLMPSSTEKINFGDAVTLACTILFAAHIVLLSVFARKFNVKQLTALQIISGALLLCVMLVALKAHVLFWGEANSAAWIVRETVLPEMTARHVWQIVYLAIAATVGTFLLWTWGQSRLSATHAAIIFSLEPVFATAFAVLVRGRGEMFGGWRAVIGALLILTGVLVSELRFGAQRRRTENERQRTGEDNEDDRASELETV